MPLLDKPLPQFEIPSTNGSDVSNETLHGKKCIIYFYPKDNTPGCTTEAAAFRDLHAEFAGAGCVILGVSRDSLKSHDNFRAKMNLPFDLLSDPDEIACKVFDVMKMKNMYGKKVRGIERSTFAVDANGVVRREWRDVKVPGHAQEVLDYIKTI